ncbi:MAG TPA: hypothetical protein VIH06_10235 [Ilumatobacteraceae bacterium]
MADDVKNQPVIAELNAQLVQSREQEALLLDALTRVLSLIEQDRRT